MDPHWISDISENYQSYRGTEFNLTLCDYQSKHFSPPNANKYILKHLQHTFQLLIYHALMLYSSKSSLFQIHHYISENYQTYRGLQFNLTLSITNKTLLAHQRKQIYSEASSTHFSAINLSYTCALPIKIPIVPNTSLYFRKLSDLSRTTV